HIARAVHANSRQNILTTALMLGAMILGAAGGSSDAVGGAMAVAQGTAAQHQINFTRANEAEADRVGIGAMAGAGFDPHGMASFFEVIARQASSLPETRTPEFLQSHPVTTARIAEARNRAREFPMAPRDDSANYGISKMRLTVADFDTADQAVNYFQQRDYANQTDIEKYGRAVAYQRAGRDREANRIFQDLVDHDKKVIAYHIGLGQTQIALEDYDAGLATLDHALELFPRNVPLVIDYAELLLRLGRAAQAHAMLLDLLNNVPPTPEQVRLIARAANEAGDVAESYYYLSEYSLMTGDLMGGIDMLQRALALPELQEIQRIRFEARIDFIRDFMTEEQLKQMQKNRPNGVTARLSER
ncbi:MAG: M48 family metalloprotease, partial [Woeseiaceae bacterium]